MHGMLCDWRKFREIFMPLEKEYHVIYPAMTGCYELRLCNTHKKVIKQPCFPLQTMIDRRAVSAYNP